MSATWWGDTEGGEINHIRAALERCSWNISQAAKQLGIDRSNLT
jgi:transcriptional regulator of acetoin/glycerol metabolism